MLLISALSFLLCILSAASVTPPRPKALRAPHPLPPLPSSPRFNVLLDPPVVSRNGTQLPPYAQTYYFDQLIDHNNPSAGTFKQRYWHTYEFYEPGGPVILSTPGEVDASDYTPYLTNKTLNGHVAQLLNGTTVLLEHRFFGNSNPHPDLSSQSLRVHTVQQAVEDLAYFAQHVQLPMPGSDQLAPGKAPWILMGGSYAGALTGYTLNSHPDVFYAGYASSAVVQAIVDFWGYFEPIRQSMPQNCSADVQAVITHVDSILLANDTTQVHNLKKTFGLDGLAHNDDFAAALQQNLFPWQSLQVSTGSEGDFYKFCDALEVKDGVSAPAQGWGLDHALQAWGSYWTSTFYTQICGSDDNELCLGTYDSTNPYWSYTYEPNPGRSWDWLLCTQFGFNFAGAPQAQPTIASRLVGAVWTERQCGYRFPDAGFQNSVASPNADGLNALYKGWNTTANRLIFANGQRDPWREATVAADNAVDPGLAMQPRLESSDGYHCSDLLMRESAASASVKKVQDDAVGKLAQWLLQWTPSA
ncbi:peptidase S28 [Daedaleopsis nitida]|nr:peptidase S28 [Daedaleopsis nitida]